ncbi:MAG: antibiotic biosynthesis monooxygenase [Propionibacteriales bacterium]|nr:antibiotic biosynthesis monooxygenase [Propionibacteriales bacterium]
MAAPAVVFASFSPRPDKVDALRAELDVMVENTRRESGCEVYDLYQSGEDAVRFHLFERYTDAAALEAHRAADYYKAYRANVADLLESPIEVAVLTEADVAGSA